MCRWLGYFGDPIRPEELLYQPARSLIEQSKRHGPGLSAANADGHGLGWYGTADTPGLFRSASPAWGDRNLREVSAQISSPLFLAHVRASTGTPVQQTNCHPFRHGQWMFVHNGFIDAYDRLRRDLLLRVDPKLFPGIEGTTDSELMFYLALTFGLADDPVGGLERMAGFIEAEGRRAGSEHPLQMTVGISDGVRLYAARYASGMEANTLYVSSSVRDLRLLYPADERLQHFSDESRVIVSEPLVDLPGLWREVPPGTALVVQEGDDLEVPFHPYEP
ncbi:class II glutamine amidotransferase [Pseudonocardia sp. CA-142604]|uniref:class II glutamine amidotransferase n=1 Tax=Pseudonocardia sp. CA-142604 TaxID=3240024 RepID=UPI003D93CE13